jgi:hypothetical protein
MTVESVMSIGRMVGGLTSLSHLTLDMTDWNCVTLSNTRHMYYTILGLNSLFYLNLVLRENSVYGSDHQ